MPKIKILNQGKEELTPFNNTHSFNFNTHEYIHACAACRLYTYIYIPSNNITTDPPGFVPLASCYA